ncbi:helix-turn-helix transcriptional regulator [Nanoarchaeota archaeon]
MALQAKISRILSISIFLIILLVNSVTAEQYTEQTSKFYIVDDVVVVDKTVKFSESFSGPFNLNIPSDASAFSLYLDNNLYGKEKTTTVNAENITSIRYTFNTKYYLDKESFVIGLKPIITINELNIELSLPEEAYLRKTKNQKNMFPAADSISSDGRSLVLEWDFGYLGKDEEISLLVLYETPKKGVGLLAFTFIIILSGLIIGFLILRKPKVIREKEIVKETVDMVEKHLKEDEEQIVNILKQREGQVEQGTLRVITGFSKAKISGLLKELEERKVIHKEKRGKKNLVFLKEL